MGLIIVLDTNLTKFLKIQYNFAIHKYFVEK